ncbi:OadG family transporter subunit [Catenovulum sp. 2E275]|uniref:OadG family protein n=1 Tax=Catenovulum sp. 2E275 TaxID=2980497 RepID=UPI0021D3822E|nr:OadG family transporter subunit [Catenovulum sp. 2E275]MCU4677616.1 OadG family transporter subunit [Catenovulum sp. 2E275]
MENNIGPVLLEAANLLLVGMVVVFAFLGILIFLVKLMSSLVGGDSPAPSATNSNQAARRPAPAKQDDVKVKAAISAAIHQYRQDNK